MPRWALGIEYDGSQYHGWQSQKLPACHTLQDELERALSRVANHKITVTCAGRTDRGVHATAQVIHFDTSVERRAAIWVSGANHFLSEDMRVLWANLVANDFHARFSARARHYRYLIYNHPIRPALQRNRVTWIAYPLCLERMQQAAEFLLGEHDFSAFRGADCQAKTPIRRIDSLTVAQDNVYFYIDVRANAFLHHMVRNIVGVLLAVGSGHREPSWVQTVLRSRNRSAAGITAPAHGLYLTAIDY